MADANQILKLLVGRPLTLSDLCRQLGGGADMPIGCSERKQITKAIGRLVGRGLVKSLTPQKQTFPCTRNGGYVATKEGRAFVKAGRSVAEHVLNYPPLAKATTGAKLKGDNFRAALWLAFRFAKRATIPELIEAAGDQGVVKTTDLAHAYMKALTRAGIAVEMKRREPGFAPTSNGFKRYALLNDLGVKPPKAAAEFLLDPNSGERIPYLDLAPSQKTEAA